MRLTSLNIKGFKSFADKTTIHFNDSITGIVGPNGCGKSNIVDSIRWVLGEQKTTHLRLDKMEHLIFNGTKNRKASSLAEVTLTFENTKNVISTEFKTVTITRRLFRNGESEYRLNDVPCRLKDIINLFLDTGVSSDSYAIIELGMIDEILNDRDHSRRKLFEQAAGISKYKRRKKETLQKLKGTDADLERVQDLLFEIEGNLKTLESQARRARKYYKLKEEYKEFSIELSKHQLAGHKDQYQRLKHAQQKESDRQIEIDKEIKQLEAKLEQEKLLNVEKEKALADVQKKLNQLISGVSGKENERNILTEQIKFAREKMETARLQLTDATERIEELRKFLEVHRSQEERETAILKDIQDDVEKLDEELKSVTEHHQLIKDDLNKDQQAYAFAEKKIFELEKQLAVHKVNKENLQREFSQNEHEVAAHQSTLGQLEQELEKVKKNKSKAETNLQKLLEKDQAIKMKILDFEKMIEQVRVDLNHENRLLDSCKNEYELTKSLVDNLEGFPESIKFLKKNAKWAKEALLLSDIIFCSEEYRVAIENYLEPYLNYYVVQNLEEAIQAVNLLNDSSMGRANFFILNEFKHHKPAQPKLFPNATPATELVELEEKYRKLGAYLLDNVYVYDDSKSFSTEELSMDKNGKELNRIMLTKSGKYIRADYTLSGGAIGLFEGKRIGRAKNLEKLKDKIRRIEKKTEKLTTKLQELQAQMQDARGLVNMDGISQQRDQLSAINQEYATLSANLGNSQQVIERNLQKNQSIDQQLKQITEKDQAIAGELDELKNSQMESKSVLEKTDKTFVEVSNKLNKATSQYNERNIVFHQQSNKVGSIRQELQYKLENIKSIEQQIERNKALIDRTNSEIEEKTVNLKKLESALLSGYSDREVIEKEVESTEQAYYKSRGDLNEMDSQLRDTLRKKQQTDTLLSEVKEKINEMKLQLNSIKERLSIEFQVDINVLLNQETDNRYEQEELEEKVMKFKQRIENFGEINPMAVEAFDEMKARYDFIQAQKKDLEEAKVSLINTIEEIEILAKEKFMDAFNKVRENFIHVFRTLFSEEDKCDLILLDAENPLESKIEIVAKPKGKRPTVIDQLSGGEKTLTATALLFSLYLLKPAPFCVFDEVDAPLDDQNIDKFNKIIQQFSADSQFIIVTHNKQTMTSVDVIYGVTMPEQGISRVVPVDFRQLN